MNEMVASRLTLFTLSGTGTGPAAAINQDGTVNSPQHPAYPGSRVMLFGTGGGATNPPSIAGEITPAEIRKLVGPTSVFAPGVGFLTVEFAGAAPGLAAGVTQINVVLPNVLPKMDGRDSALLPIQAGGDFRLGRQTNEVTLYVTGY